MALVALSPQLTSFYLTTRPGPKQPPPTEVYDGTVADLIVDDWLLGSRTTVVSVGATTGGLRTLTLRRVNSNDVTVNWVATSSIRLAR